MPFKIEGTSPDGNAWHHSSHYPSLGRAYRGLEDAIRAERKGSEHYTWDAAEHKISGLPLGWDIKLPNGWSFRIEKQED